MKYYRLALDDQPRLTWLIHVQDSRSGRLSPLPEYEGFVCPRCGKFSYDDVFERGFVKAARLKRPSGDVIATDDGFYCANARFKTTVEQSGFEGLKFKQIANTDWYVINVSERFEVSMTPFKTVRGPCDACGRLREVIGLPDVENDFISLPQREQFFSTTLFVERSGSLDRDIYATKKIAEHLRAERLKGGVFQLLLDQSTRAEQRRALEAGKRLPMPRDAHIFLR